MKQFINEKIAKGTTVTHILLALNEAQIRYISPHIILPFLKPPHNLNLRCLMIEPEAMDLEPPNRMQ